MKKSSLSVYASVAILAGFLLSSCAGSRQFTEDLRNSRDPDRDKFVVTNDSTLIESEKLSFKSPLFKAQKVVLDNGTEVKVKDLIAYQDDNAFYIRLHQTPFGFAHRMKRGSINMYRAISTESYYDAAAGPTTYNGGTGSMNSSGGWSRRTVYHYFLEKNNSREVVKFSPENVEKMVNDYRPAMDFVDLYKSNKVKYRRWSWINTAAVFGGIALMATAANGNSVQPQGYVGLGFLLGGFVNGFVNKSKKARNVNNLILAVDEYNSGSERSKKKKSR